MRRGNGDSSKSGQKQGKGSGRLCAKSADRPELVILIPMVLMIRHPPNAVPNPMAVWQATMIQAVCTLKRDSLACASRYPAANSSAKIIPIVF